MCFKYELFMNSSLLSLIPSSLLFLLLFLLLSKFPFFPSLPFFQRVFVSPRSRLNSVVNSCYPFSFRFDLFGCRYTPWFVSGLWYRMYRLTFCSGDNSVCNEIIFWRSFSTLSPLDWEVIHTCVYNIKESPILMSEGRKKKNQSFG